MAMLLTGSPAVEPVTLAEAKLHLRIDGADEDVLINSLIVTSRMTIESALGLALISQTWTLVRDAWPQGSTVKLPIRPVQSINSARVLSATGVPTNLAPADYVLEGQGTPPRFVRTGWSWPQPGKVAGGIEISFVAGYGPNPSDVPSPIRQALLLLITHWYEHRDPIEFGTNEANIPKAVSDLLASFRTVKL
jgi:uncharacterized phiE125 gp8 family phage protein